MVEPLTLVTSWFTPTSLFLLLNAVIAVIAISSVFASRAGDHRPPPEEHTLQNLQQQRQTHGGLARAPSIFSRFTSFNYNFNADYGSAVGEDERDPYATSFTNGAAPPPQISRAPSLLSRMTSFNNFNGFSLCRSVEPENPPAAVEKPQIPIARAPSFLSRMTSFSHSYGCAKPENPAPAAAQPKPSIARAPSLLSRMSSINFSLYRSEPPPAPEVVQTEAREQHVTRSATAPKKKKKAVEDSKMKKSSSEKAAKQTTSFLRKCDEEVDAKADDFINKFKQQLRLQRLDSILRYRSSDAPAGM